MNSGKPVGTFQEIIASRRAIHGYLWIVLFLLVFLTTVPKDEPGSWMFRLGVASTIIAITLPPVYLHFLLLEKFLFRKRYGVYALLLLVVVAGYAFLFQFLSMILFAKRNDAGANIALILFLLALSTSIKLLGDTARQRFQLQAIRAKQSQTELDLLKAQIHPHFFFNALNNLFGLARRRDPSAADGIARLSHLMRYMIYESNVDRIELEKEVEQIRRLIALERLRFSPEDNIEVDFEVDGQPGRARIAPMLLLPLVENAFKHGISLSMPSFIRVRLKIAARSLNFAVANSNHSRESGTEGAAGLGLENVKRRLELLYPGAYHLSVGESRGVFQVELRLDNLQGDDFDEMRDHR